MLKKILLISIFVSSFSFLDCKSSVENYPVHFVDRNTVFSLDKRQKPLMLVVEIAEDGKLCLNKIETGTIADISHLSEKLKVILKHTKRVGLQILFLFVVKKGDAPPPGTQNSHASNNY